MDTKGRAESLTRCGPRRISHPSRTASSSNCGRVPQGVTGSDGFLRLRVHARLLINARFWRQFHLSRLRRRSPRHPMHELLKKAVVALLTRLAFAFGLLGVSGAIVIVMGQCF